MLSFVGRGLQRERQCTGWLPYAGAMRRQADLCGADILLVMPENHSSLLTPWHRDCLAEYGVQFVPVGWSTPPGMRFWHEGWNWRSQNGWCGPMDLIRLHALGFTQYDAVAYFDRDVEFQGDVLPILRCAATGYLLNTIGPMSPINMGFLAVRPNAAWLQAVVNFAREADFNRTTGWAGAMFKPDNAKYI
ncbi:unnamed protein product [Prorocentrum cordatum]|uniref:Nucleotide-diphospho-sugar transferase domain-containing protein n=1 Tax=Prorocentrum cordatum TaxID=2364126 RepID=A0ABN9Q4B9_9DINO|nr:unnamed protein product [Polarella glacialis]